MLSYKRTSDCLGYIFIRLCVMIRRPRLERPPYGVALKELLEFLRNDCQTLLEDERVRLNEYKWEEFNLRMLRCAMLLISVLLNQRGIKTMFASIPPSDIYDGIRFFRPILEDLQRFLEAGGWFEDEKVADVLQARLETVIQAALRIKGNIARGDSEEAREQTQCLFEGMLRQVFILLIRPPIAALLE